MPLEIRLASMEEALHVHRTMIAAFSQYVSSPAGPSGATREREEDVRAAMAKGGAILALLDGRPVGSARFSLHPDHLYFGRLATLPECQGQGVGRAMIAWLEEHARQLGLPEVHLNVRMSLRNNWRLYSSLGYETVSLMPHRLGTDLIATMIKRLAPPAENGFLTELFSQLVSALRDAEPSALAILLFSSGDAGPFSNLSVRVVTDGEPAVRDRVRFVERPDGSLVHVSIGSRPFAEAARTMEDPAKVLWEKPGTSARLLNADRSGYYLETLLKYAAKVKNAVARGDEHAVRTAAAGLADMCSRLLRPVNAPAPDRCDQDLPLHSLALHALRLAESTVAVIEENQAALQLPDDLASAVSDGTVRRYLTGSQML